ncbi:hypothetical protein ACLF3G_20495 [Falsiroseomonas sp. HC035]|uniref:hypothetical protein n=1 Tax=Falsiroseomonas sp. HC035 TaxID=3390999 RepID=UPI003D3164F4
MADLPDFDAASAALWRHLFDREKRRQPWWEGAINGGTAVGSHLLQIRDDPQEQRAVAGMPGTCQGERCARHLSADIPQMAKEARLGAEGLLFAAIVALGDEARRALAPITDIQTPDKEIEVTVEQYIREQGPGHLLDEHQRRVPDNLIARLLRRENAAKRKWKR